MDHCAIPQDVSPCWNSTFDMLKIALKCCKAIDLVSADWDLQLQPYEPITTKWKIAEQLHEILHVVTAASLFWTTVLSTRASHCGRSLRLMVCTPTVVPPLPFYSQFLAGCHALSATLLT